MKILFVTDGLATGGKERQLSYLIKGWLDLGNEAVIVSFDNTIGYKIFKSPRVKVHFLKASGRKNLAASFKLRSICKKEKAQVIHTWDTYSSLCSFWASLTLGVPLINGSVRTTFLGQSKSAKLLSNLSYLFCNIVLANSKAGLNSIGQHTNHKFRVIYNGIDTDDLQSAGHESDIPVGTFEEGNQYVMMLANYSEFKDYDTLLKVAATLIPKHKGVRFILAGAGVKEFLEPRLSQELKSKVKLFDQIENPGKWISQIDIGVLSTFTEGISNTVMEYMAHGKPVVATNTGGMSELVAHEQEGFLTGLKSSDELTTALLFLLQNPQDAQKMGMAAKQKIQDKFALSNMIQSYESLYTQLGN